jgi:hypothetical protein
VHHSEQRKRPKRRSAAPRRRPPAGQPLNRQALDNIRALSRADGDALLERVIQASWRDAAPAAAMREAIAGADAEALRKVAHSLKSGSANVGADGLAQLCKEMENWAAPAAPKARPRCCSRCSRHSCRARSLSAILVKEH